MKNIIPGIFFFLLITSLALTSCSSSKKLTYFRDLSDTASLQVVSAAKVPPVQLQPDDQIQLTISSPNPDASRFFNLMSANPNTQLVESSASPQSFLNTYNVSADGSISLPVLGSFQVEGKTLDQLKQNIVTALKPYLTNPIVSVRLTNFKVTVIGEVNKPVSIAVSGEKINVLEALGAAGDMTLYSARNKVKVIRKRADGNTEIAKLDFNNSSTLQSPYFNLRQNDIIYVQPGKNKSFLANNTTFWASLVVSIASIAAIIITRN